jgi:pimeloyl-ACP methyl ester carboxylesterase
VKELPWIPPDARSDRPWDAFTDDQLGRMDHLGIDEFMVLGFCIGGPSIWNLLERAPNRVVAAVLAQPSGWRPEMPTERYDANMTGWGPELVNVAMEAAMLAPKSLPNQSVSRRMARSSAVKVRRS